MFIFLTIDVEDKYYPVPRLIHGLGLPNELGILHIMSALEQHALPGVFFVNVYEEHNFSPGVMADILRSISTRGHSVELHTHYCTTHPNFQRPLHRCDLAQQTAIIAAGRQSISDATGTAPTAHRGGGFCADDDMLRALAQAGIRIDSSHLAHCTHSAIGGSPPQNLVFERHGIIEVPVSYVERHEEDGTVVNSRFDLEPYSLAELKSIVKQAQRAGLPTLTFTMHSFSFLRRRKKRVSSPHSNDALFSSPVYAGYYNELFGEDLQMVEKFDKFLKFLARSMKGQVTTLRHWLDAEHTQHPQRSYKASDHTLTVDRRSPMPFWRKGRHNT